MQYKIGRSSKRDRKEAIGEASLGLVNPKFIFYCAGIEHFEAYTEEISNRFPEAVCMGATTFAAFDRQGAHKETLMILGIESGIECYGDVLEDADRYPLKYVDRVEACVTKMKDARNTMCFEVSSALMSSEEFVLSTLNSVLEKKDIPIFGGSAGDFGKAEKTMIGFNGKVYDKACAFVLIKNLSGKIRFYQENIYKPTKHHFFSTKVDVKNRIVHEYNNRPAAEVMAEALGTTLSQLPKYLDSYPLGRIIGDKMYITANQMITANKGMAYHAKVYNNSHMVLLEPDDYKEVVKCTLAQIKEEVPRPQLTLVVHCLARSILFEKEGYLNDFAKELGGTLGEYVGFGGYGEQLGKQHFNQTMIVAVFE
ncbi:MAG: FIST signal transduction protein [Cellulosilyticaceae bacterium]